MDTTTLVFVNVLLFVLYASVVLVNARVVGGMKEALWFAGANLCRGLSMLLVGVEWLHLERVRWVDAFSGTLAMVGVLLLHKSFAELLEQKAILQRLQFVLVGLMVAVLFCFIFFPARSLQPFIALYATLGMQYALVAVLVFRFSPKDAGIGGWLTSLILIAYAFIFFFRAAMVIGWQSQDYLTMKRHLFPIWLTACLVTTTGTAFGFVVLSSAKLRMELLRRAQVDDLTGLLNRWALRKTALREVQRCLRGRHSLAVVTLDLDGLKHVNDTKGHSCGDVILQAVAGVLQDVLRGHDSVARMGGDEFCVLLPETSMDEAMRVAERLRLEIGEMTVRFRGQMVRTSASLGVACSDISGLEWQNLIDDSDAALYRAKHEGRNRVIAAVAGAGQTVPGKFGVEAEGMV
ncbi:MAG TPA: GGDEF domain-containing protein [Edaphobacter sp.]